jgi:16S rRNA (guanine966-N2)-methyltransferase
VRPTAEEVRVRWLDVLGPFLPGARVLDLFSGSGALGLEALSRGATRADFVENGPAALHALKANVAALRKGSKVIVRIFKKDAVAFVEALEAGSYDLVLADPPYGSGKLDRIVRRWVEVPYGTVLSVEHARGHPLPTGGSTHEFGETALTFFGLKGARKTT